MPEHVSAVEKLAVLKTWSLHEDKGLENFTVSSVEAGRID